MTQVAFFTVSTSASLTPASAAHTLATQAATNVTVVFYAFPELVHISPSCRVVKSTAAHFHVMCDTHVGQMGTCWCLVLCFLAPEHDTDLVLSVNWLNAAHWLHLMKIERHLHVCACQVLNGGLQITAVTLDATPLPIVIAVRQADRCCTQCIWSTMSFMSHVVFRCDYYVTKVEQDGRAQCFHSSPHPPV